MTAFPYLYRKEIPDEFAQENFKRILDYFTKDAITRANFEFLTVSPTAAVTNLKVPHKLGYVPKDVILMHNLNNVTVTFNYSKFDATNIDVTLSGATTIRFLAGRYE